MTRDSEIPAIFNPSRVRTPSVVVTGDSPNGSFMSGFTNVINTSNPQIGRSDSISQPDGVDLVPGTTNIHSSNAATTPTTNIEMPQNRSRLTKCKESCCSELAQKVLFPTFCSSIAINIKIYRLILLKFTDVFWCMCNDFSNRQLGQCHTLH